MGAPKLKLVVSDFHLGRGRYLRNGDRNPLEDFNHDNRFQEWLDYYSQPPYDEAEIEIVFNGDMLNLIQVDYHGHFPVVISEAVSEERTKAVIAGHPVFFKSLKRFLAKPGKSITYIIGNHDQEMMWKKTQKIFEEAVGAAVNWRNFYYEADGIHIEHGHQFEAVNRIDPTLPFLTDGLPEPILNLPWGSLFTAQYIVRMKMLRPYIDKVRPFRMVVWWSLLHDTGMAFTGLLRLVLYFISTRFSRNRYRYSSWKVTMKILFEASVFPDLSDSAKRILRSPQINTVIFGHTHVYKYVQLGEGKQYLNLGTWTEIVSMDLESYARRSRLTYARIEYDDQGKPTPLLRHWIGRIPLDDDALT